MKKPTFEIEKDVGAGKTVYQPNTTSGLAEQFRPTTIEPNYPPATSGDEGAVGSPESRGAPPPVSNRPPVAAPIQQSRGLTSEQIRRRTAEAAGDRPFRESDAPRHAEPLNLPQFATSPDKFKGEATATPTGPNVRGEAPIKGDPFALARERFAASNKTKPAATATPNSVPNDPPASPPPPPPIEPPQPAVDAEPEKDRFTPPSTGKVEAGWQRVQVPSLCVPYDWDDIQVRLLELDDLAALYAAIQSNSYTMFLDALNNAVDVEIRNLTGPDLRTLMYWWRRNSYARSPYTLNWTSRYGNRCATSIFTQTDLQTKFLAMSPEAWAGFRDRGLCFPTVRDAEYLDELNLSPALNWKARRAQYVAAPPGTPIDADWYPRRIEALRIGGTAMLEDIREFKLLADHGPTESLELTDDLFEPVAASAYLKTVAEDLTRMIEGAGDTNATFVLETAASARDYLDEANDIDEKLRLVETARSAGETSMVEALTAAIKPRKETKVLNITALDFFPEI